MTADMDPTILKEWLNYRLATIGGYVSDLYEDLRDGRNLILLLEVLSDQRICRERGRLRNHMLRNARVILNFVGIEEDDNPFDIRGEDIVNGDQNKIRFLVTMIFRKFQCRMSEPSDEAPVCEEDKFDRLVNIGDQIVLHDHSNKFDQNMSSIAVNESIERGDLLHSEKMEDLAGDGTQKSFWQERLESLTQLILPYEKINKDVVPNWKCTVWSRPILNADVANAKRMLLDAFVIYLARVVGDSPLHIGWETRRNPATWEDATTNYHLVPMIVTVPLDEPWSSVSEVVDEELAILARNTVIPVGNVVSSASGDTHSSVGASHPWRIAVSMAVRCDFESEYRSSSGTVLTLQVKQNGEFRWLYNESSLDSDVVARITEHLTVLTSEYLATDCHELAVRELNTLPNGERNFLLTNSISREEIASCNGKIDTQASPSLDERSFVPSNFEAPQNEIEICLAEVWKNHFGVERISRHDSFFALGGHSLIAVESIESLMSHGLEITLADSYRCPTLSDLARTARDHTLVVVPPNPHKPGCQKLTPKMLPLVDITQSDIDFIVSSIPGGLPNIQDIYGLSPLQEGLLFHHLRSQNIDPYVIITRLAFRTHDRLDCYLEAYQRVIDRHDTMRTAIVWEGLTEPVQVVCRRAQLPIIEITLESEGCLRNEQLATVSTRSECRINLNEAPLIRMIISREGGDQRILTCLIHHIVCDGGAQTVINNELLAFMNGCENTLNDPYQFRNHIALIRQNQNEQLYTQFFTEMLADIEEPTPIFGLSRLHFEGMQIDDSISVVSPTLVEKMRFSCKTFEVSLAILCHLAWALVVSRTSGKIHVVFGTVLSGRTDAGANSKTGVGLYINTLPLRVDIDDTLIRSSLKNVQLRLSQLLTYQHAPLAVAQRCSGVTDGVPLFNSLLNFRSNSSKSYSAELNADMMVLQTQSRTTYPLTMSVDDDGLSLALEVLMVRPFDPSSVSRYMQQAFVCLVDALAMADQTTTSSLDILPEIERTILIQKCNDDSKLDPDPTCIHCLFERQVLRMPSARALVYEDQQMTYEELNSRSNQLAHLLISLGVVPDSLVGICVSVSPAMLIGILGILKAGGAYVPLDPVYPSQRLIDIISDASLYIIIADKIGISKLKDDIFRDRILVDPNESIVQPNANPVVSSLNSKNLAYAIYTSGSTGRPKGVMVEHKNIVRLFDTTDCSFRFCEQDVWSLTHSFAFDFSVWEIWGALRYGGRLVLVPREIIRSMDATYELVCEHRVSVLNQTPSQFKVMINKFLENPIRDQVRYIIFGGESLDPSFLRALYDARKNRVPQLWNMFGITETTVHSTCLALREADTLRSVSLVGRHLPDSRIYLLDTNCRPVPFGVIGELYIGGSGVARGYLNRPNLTRDRFVLDPFSDAVDARMYKTSDLARFISEGNLEFMGRDDQQVKIRGYRIEPGEVEGCLRSHEAVREVRVVMLGDDLYKRLFAYVVADQRDDLEAILLAHAKSRLPEFMVPSAIIRVDAIPLTPNGKIDLQALSSWEMEAVIRNSDEAPVGELETIIASIWEDLLSIQNVSRQDSFFALGGNSLLAVRMIQRVRSHGYELAINALYAHPTLTELASTVVNHVQCTIPYNRIPENVAGLTPEMLPLIDLTQTDIDRIVSQVPGGVNNVQDIYALSPLQDGMLFHHMLNTGTDPYLSWNQRIFSDNSILERYIRATQIVIDRHDVLRTVFFWENLTTPAQVVLRKASLYVTERTLDFQTELDVSAYPSIIRNCSLDLREAPLLHFVIARRSDNSWVQSELIHHIIADHESFEMMHAEIYAILVKQENTLPNPVPFRNFIAHVRSGIRSEAHQNFFAQVLAEIDEPTLCFGLAEIYSDSLLIEKSHRTLSCEINHQLRHQAAHLDVSPATLCHVAWGLVVSRTSKREKIVFGTVLFGRIYTSNVTDSQMGLYINTLPIKLIINDTPLIDCVRQSHQTLGHLLEHENASLVIAQRCSRIPKGTALFNSILNYRHDAMSRRINDIVPGIQSLGAHVQTNYPVTFSVDDDSASFEISSQTAEPVDPDRVCAYMQQALESIIENLDLTPNVSVNLVEILPVGERRMLLEEWNAGIISKPEFVCIHQLFEKQVILTPTKTAVTYESENMTYEELNFRANWLAHHLIKLGIMPDCLVGICMAPSLAMIVSLLAVHKAGGAYVPLDAASPGQRIFWIIEDTNLEIVIADENGAKKLTDNVLRTLIVINPNEQFGQAASNPVVRDLSPTNLAYVIYTSGTTGQPKGVMVEHRNIVRLFESTDSLFHFGPNDNWGLLHSITCDISVLEMWGALRYGGQLVVVSRNVVRSPDARFNLILAHRVTAIVQTASEFSCISEKFQHPSLIKHLRLVMIGSEYLDPRTLKPLYDALGDTAPRFLNLYGPTETTVFSTIKEFTVRDTVHSYSIIGKGLPDTSIYLLDDLGRPVPFGVDGEIFIGGGAVARGYLNKSDLTTKSFRENTFYDSLGSRLYKTGDIARYLPDGNIVILGRNDEQIKIRGFRVETSEIVTCLVGYPGIHQAVVKLVGDSFDKFLIAYVVSEARKDLAHELREHLISLLPDYMIPAKFVRLDNLPLNSNGKLDHRALPMPDSTSVARMSYDIPKTHIE